MVDPDGRCPVPVQKEGDMYVCPQTLDGGEVEAISDETRRQRREYLAGGDYMLYGLGEGFVYMVGIGAGIYGGGAYLAGAGIETATTSLLTHRTVIQGSQIATEIMASEAGLVGVGGAAAVGAKQVAEEVVEEAVEVAGKTSNNLWKVGSYSEIKGLEVGLDAHHVGQKAVMKNFVSGYNLNTAPSILVPEVGHTIRGVNGIVSRSTSGFTNARQVLARDIFELRRVYGGQGIPNSSLQQLIQMNKTMYPGAFIK